jgi:hypothetical protein
VDQDGVKHGFLLQDEKSETFDVPNSCSTDIWMISNDGWFVGDYCADTVFAFVRNNRGDYITLKYPGTAGQAARSINDRHEVVGRFDDYLNPDFACTNQCHGFFWSNGEFRSIDVPGALYTIAMGINNLSHIVGRFVDSSNNEHGFIARPRDES